MPSDRGTSASRPTAPAAPPEHRLHPLSIGFSLAGQIRRAILPLIVGGASANVLGGVEMQFILLLGFIPLGIGSIVHYMTFRYRYEATELVIRSGLFFRRERHVPYARIQNLDAVQGVLHRVFNVVEVKLQTGGGDEPEATMTVLPLTALDALRDRVREGKRASVGKAVTPAAPDVGPESRVAPSLGADRGPGVQPASGADPAPEADPASGVDPVPGVPDGDSALLEATEARTLLHLPARELLLHGLLQNRGMVLIAAAFGLAWETGIIERASDWVVGEQTAVGGMVEGAARDALAAGLPVLVAAIMALVVAFVIFARLISIAWTLVRLHDYRIVRADEGLRTTFGLLTRVAATIPLRRVQTVTIHEGPLQRWANRVAVGVQTAGGGQAGKPGNEGQDRHQLAPILRRTQLREFLREIIPELETPEVRWEPVSPRAFGRVARGGCLLATLASVPLYVTLGAWGGALHAAFLAWAVLFARRYVDHLGWALKDDMVWFRSGWLWRRTTIARYTRMQVVATQTTPIDRWRGMARLRVDTAGAGAASHKVDIPYLPLEAARDLRSRLAAEAARTEFHW